MTWIEAGEGDKYIPRLHKTALMASRRRDSGSGGIGKALEQGSGWKAEKLSELERGYREAGGAV
jgi:hypothetical protein